MQISPLVKRGLQTRIIGQTVHFFRDLPSTNDLAKELAGISAKEGTVIIAEKQTKGKGRQGRDWISPEGGLWFSVILRPKVSPEHSLKLTLLAAVAVTKTLEKLYPLPVQVKWPNDVLINGKKVCGILSEADINGKQLNFVVIGFGINVDFHLSKLPAYLHDSSTTLREELSKKISIDAVFRSVLEQLEHHYLIFNEGNFDFILSEWRRFAKFLGSYVYVTSADERIEGWALDIDEQGALIVKLRDGTTRRMLAGDVTLSR